VKARPPPPAYDAVMVNKFNSLTRGGTGQLYRFDSASSLEKALSERRLSERELVELIQFQREREVCQREELSRLDAVFCNENERELLQLRKQHNNLQAVLNSLRNGSWTERLDHERREASHLHESIDAIKVAIGDRRRELNSLLETQRSIQLQYAIEEQRQGEGGNH